MSAGYVRVLAFGPIAEAIGSRTTKVEWRENLSIEEIVVELDMGHWLGQVAEFSMMSPSRVASGSQHMTGG